jgi:hypothetical protein
MTSASLVDNTMSNIRFILAATVMIGTWTNQGCEGFQPNIFPIVSYDFPRIASVVSRSTQLLSSRLHSNGDEFQSVLLYQDDDRNRFHRINTANTNNNDIPISFLNGSSSSHLNEYDHDAEFYRRRNQEFYTSIQKMQQQDTYNFNDLTSSKQTTTNLSLQQQQQELTELKLNPNAQKKAEDVINSVLKASRSSFKNIEKITFRLLNRQPLVALGIFLATIALLAYMTGFFILEGYIDNLNPAENDLVPYWDDPEIHTIMRKP